MSHCRILYEGTYMHMYRSTPQSTTEQEERERVRDHLLWENKEKKVRWKELSNMDTDEESCSSENSSLETDLMELSQ